MLRWGKSSCAGACALHEWTGNPDEGGPVAPARAIDPGRDAREHMLACTGAGYGGRSIDSRLEKVEDDVDGYEKASKGLASLQALNPATEGKYTAPPPAFMRYKV